MKKYIGVSVLIAFASVLTNPIIVNSESVLPLVDNTVALALETENEEITEVETETEENVQDLINSEMDALLDSREVTLEWYAEWQDFQAKWGIQNTPYNFSDEEMNLVYRCVETETYQAEFVGKVNVCSVIFNRLYSENEFGKSLKEVITTPKQFSYFRTEISEETKLAVSYYLEFGDTTGGCLYFHSFSEPIEFFGEYQFTDEIGHHFYK